MFVWFLYNPSAWASGWDFCFGSAQNWGGFCFKPCFQPSSPILPSLQDQRHCAAVAAAGCPSIFLTFTVSLTKQIARDTESLLISLLLKTSRCFSRCQTLKMPSGMQEAASGPGAEPWAQRHPEREAQLKCSAAPAEHIREKVGEKKPKQPHTTLFLIN